MVRSVCGSCLFSFFVFFLGITINGQAQKVESIPGPVIVCPADFDDQHTSIPPPERFLKEQFNSARRKTSTFEVTYVGFSTEARAAFQQAIDIWETLLVSEVPIRVLANWRPLASGTLGSSSSGTLFRNFQGAPKIQTWYPVALAEKITRTEMNDNEPDIVANFNSGANWYLGLDASPESGEFDLVSVVLHEIAHGLGFSGSFSVSGVNGSYGFSGFPQVYDHFVENGSGLQLIDSENFNNNSPNLSDQLTGSSLFFSGDIVKNNNGGNRAEIYAPDPFDNGSSISHLDETRFPSGTVNSLMTPQIGASEAIHNPGPITLNLFADLGWIHTNIDHEPLTDTEDLSSSFQVTANITSDTIVFFDSLFLHYSTDTFKTSERIKMQATGNPNEYQALLPEINNPDGAFYFYYISVYDSTQRQFTSPGQAPDLTSHRFYVGADTVPPNIIHTPPLEFLRETDETVSLEAIATDNIGLDTVLIDYFVNNVQQESFGLVRSMEPDQEDLYEGEISLTDLSLQVGDTLKYRIVAIDSSSNNNMTLSPEDSLHQFIVEEVFDPVSSYSNDFNTASADLAGDFFVSTPSGFSDGALHTKHPYDSAGQQRELNFIHRLRIPITVAPVDQKPFIVFDEIVLVEPGEDGTVFGSDQFWDFVIVEGSSDDGETWQPLAPGYDSRSEQEWLNRYNSALSSNGQLSSAVGDPALFKSRVINITDTFDPGTNIWIRFRLFSDQLAIGWGWAIDNLVIQGDIDDKIINGLNDFIDSKEDVSLYPNPTNGSFTLDVRFKKPLRTFSVAIFNLLGEQVFERTFENTGIAFSNDINLQQNPDGLYLVRMEIDGEFLVKKVLIRK
ncbi:T9SS type A sorting domain-containing protein [Fulvivirgaceae bacterium BMA10]|uniref:T9SS type A sorting domain-containing protein n=1 Tax=Splendidivirga corallicola TaxID=3051826 RepID=A0ABT8KQE6_9BACT|nr:T9SS type A sorting domain-containing protein [Fulvivirgaceae bacterium BMA10]